MIRKPIVPPETFRDRRKVTNERYRKARAAEIERVRKQLVEIAIEPKPTEAEVDLEPDTHNY